MSYPATNRQGTHCVFCARAVAASRTWSHPLVNGGHSVSPGRGGDRWQPESLTGANCPIPFQPRCPEDLWRQCFYSLWALSFLCEAPRSFSLRVSVCGLHTHTHTQDTSGRVKKSKVNKHRQDDAALKTMNYFEESTVKAAEILNNK